MLAIDIPISNKILPGPNNIEVIVVQITTRNPLTLHLVHNPPNSFATYQQNFLNFLSNIMQSDNNVVILGDFNMPDICWTSLSAGSNFSTLYCDMVFKYNFSQLIHIYMETHWT